MGVARQKERAATVKQRKAVFQAEKESETVHTHFMIANHVNETTSSRMVTSHQSRNYVGGGGMKKIIDSN